MEEITIPTLEWFLPEYIHKDRTPDWFWSIGLIALVAAAIAIWFHNYVFAIFILLSGASLILFTLRRPHTVTFRITTAGITMGKDTYTWKEIKGFHIKAGDPYYKLLLMTSKKFLPIYTVPFPQELSKQIRDSLTVVTANIELEESQSVVFMEKLGF